MPSSGSQATTQSLNLHAAQKSAYAQSSVGYADAAVTRDAQERVRTVGQRTFFLQNGVWTDSAFDPAKKQPITDIQAFSPAHFALLKAMPDLAACSSLGDRVLIVLANGHILRLAPQSGATTLDAATLKALTGS